MKFGSREICDVVFKAKSNITIGKTTFKKHQPVLYLDTAKTSTLEGAATTVYSTGGRGNSRLIAWEGEKTLTFTVEDALLSPVGFSILSGAGLMDVTASTPVHVHMTSDVIGEAAGVADLSEIIDEEGYTVCDDIEIFGTILDGSGSGIGFLSNGVFDSATGEVTFYTTEAKTTPEDIANKTVKVDYYIIKTAGAQQLVIDAENFAGFYYVEASTLFRRQDNDVDMPAEIIIPNVKIQSNFTFAMASSGDPSTFTFTMDAFPGYTRFNRTKKLLCAIQIIGDDASASAIDSEHSDSDHISI